jgi:release factor glutamine methyltransferase
MHTLVQTYTHRLAKTGHDNPKRTIEELLAHHLNCKPLEIYTRTTMDESMLEADFNRLLQNEPLQYILGTAHFYGIEFNCDPRALIPRPETESLIELILQSDLKDQLTPRLIDVGTGTGCIALTLANHLPNAHLEAVDSSEAALALTWENAQKLGLSERLTLHHNNLLSERPDETYDAVISNPPYISTPHWNALASSVKEFEPRAALDAGPEGTECYEALAPEAWRALKPNGHLFLEIGYDQGNLVQRILQRNGFHAIQLQKDLNGHDRIIHARK